MQQRRPRLGDILDDYCPRERRITNHAVVAMIEDQVKQTRCSTCDTEHVYKQGKAPTPRRKKEGALIGAPPEHPPRARVVEDDSVEPLSGMDEPTLEGVVAEAIDAPELFAGADPVVAEADPISTDGASLEDDPDLDARPDDDGPVHRPLIRATLPRPEGQPQERKDPEFTVRQPGARGGRGFDGNSTGQRHGSGRRPARPGQGGGGSGQQRFGAPFQGNSQRHGSGQRQDGNRAGNPGGQRGPGKPGPGGNGRGRKRGR